ncbi:tubulin nucleotide-binding domain-like protein [Coemansia reversa NRRL 1564]|uniref:Tubulin nucleotide-binding domain-like protein n=1 Tax=Coemansia reversa (strain ATCC 12441 / NRRL 1564) TaxID=763665 RepID=A0A2G5BFY1_COERN|nr:tubulin nucleotide-binding domain-like protein [Coemansia reversa NRRL 1564]|eukprot:PIA17627.1 tubulin nucleotide-binding domain-like protein [Coemansia reversa NRRL 1564]
MREVVTLQFGEYANYVGAHYWNLQYACNDQDPDWVLFREQNSRQTQPRALVFDTAGNFGALEQSEELRSAGNDSADKERALWSGSMEVHRQPLHAKSEPQQAGEGRSDQGRFWSDFGQARFAPQTISAVSGVEFGNSLGEMNTFQEGMQVFAGNDSREDALEGGFRVLAEECDHLQGFQVMADAFGGFAGYGSAFIARIRDEYPKAPVLLYSIGGTQRSSRLQGTRLMDTAVATASNVEFVSMNVPLFAPSFAKLRGHVQVADDNLYQTSGFMALNVAQWSHSLRSGRHILDEIVALVTQQEHYNVAEALLAPGLRMPTCVSSRSSSSNAALAEADEIVQRSFVGCSDAAIGGLRSTAGLMVADRGTAMGELVAGSCPPAALASEKAPVALPRQFPGIFHKIDRNGFLGVAGEPVQMELDRLRVAGVLCTSAASLGYLQQLHGALRVEQATHFKDYERDTVRGLRHALDTMIDRYSML